jgi:hypothetical protein
MYLEFMTRDIRKECMYNFYYLHINFGVAYVQSDVAREELTS